MPKINIVGYRISIPGHPIVRVPLGTVLVLGGLVGFLPVVGYWMVPVGLAILAVDIPPVRRLQRRMNVAVGNGLHKRWPNLAKRIGYGEPRPKRKA